MRPSYSTLIPTPIYDYAATLLEPYLQWHAALCPDPVSFATAFSPMLRPELLLYYQNVDH
jgi:hypothetical protein